MKSKGAKGPQADSFGSVQRVEKAEGKGDLTLRGKGWDEGLTALKEFPGGTEPGPDILGWRGLRRWTRADQRAEKAFEPQGCPTAKK